jgi:hypothetical protein
MGIFLAILGLIAAGCIVAYVVSLSVRWIVGKIREKKAMGNIKKVAVADIDTLIRECDNTVTLADLDTLASQGYSHVMVDIDASGKIVGDVDIIKDTNDTLDADVERLLGKKGMVVVEV